MGSSIEALLEIQGIGKKTVEKLKELGYTSLRQLAHATIRELVEKGISESTAKKIIKYAKDKFGRGLVTGWDLYQQRQKIQRITTGSSNLDELFGGGIEVGALTEAYGEYGSGKSQLGFQLCVNVQLPKEKGGLKDDQVEPYVFFIDTEGTFRPERIEQMAKAVGLDYKEVLNHIFVERVLNTEEQIEAVHKIPELIEEGYQIKLIVVDSLTALFRAEFVGRGALAERQQLLNAHIRDLLKLAATEEIAVYFTNQVVARPDTPFGPKVTAIGGHVLAHASTYRVELRRSKDNIRIARMVDAPNIPEKETTFRITKEGIRD